MTDDSDGSPFHPGIEELLALVGDAIVSIDEGGRILLFNRAAESLFGYARQEVLGSPVECLMPDRFGARHREEVSRYAGSPEARSRLMGQRREIWGRRRDGEEFPLEATLSRLAIGDRTLFTVVVRDITERRRAEEQRRLLTRELAHRMKNIMAVVHSVVRLAGRGSHSVEQYRRAVETRLAAIARASDLLVQASFEGMALQDLLEAELEPFRDQARRNILLSGPAVAIPERWAMTLALVFHELATNAVKYGALSIATGKVEVGWKLAGKEEGRLELIWRETGGPPVAAPSRKGFGTEVIERSLTRGRGGEARLSYLPEGLLCHIAVSLVETR